MVFQEVFTNGAHNNCLFNAVKQGLPNHRNSPGLWQQPASSWRQKVLTNLKLDEAFGFADAEARAQTVEIFQECFQPGQMVLADGSRLLAEALGVSHVTQLFTSATISASAFAYICQIAFSRSNIFISVCYRSTYTCLFWMVTGSTWIC